MGDTEDVEAEDGDDGDDRGDREDEDDNESLRSRAGRRIGGLTDFINDFSFVDTEGTIKADGEDRRLL